MSRSSLNHYPNQWLYSSSPKAVVIHCIYFETKERAPHNMLMVQYRGGAVTRGRCCCRSLIEWRFVAHSFTSNAEDALLLFHCCCLHLPKLHPNHNLGADTVWEHPFPSMCGHLGQERTLFSKQNISCICGSSHLYWLLNAQCRRLGKPVNASCIQYSVYRHFVWLLMLTS